MFLGSVFENMPWPFKEVQRSVNIYTVWNSSGDAICWVRVLIPLACCNCSISGRACLPLSYASPFELEMVGIEPETLCMPRTISGLQPLSLRTVCVFWCCTCKCVTFISGDPECRDSPVGKGRENCICPELPPAPQHTHPPHLSWPVKGLFSTLWYRTAAFQKHFVIWQEVSC